MKSRQFIYFLQAFQIFIQPFGAWLCTGLRNYSGRLYWTASQPRDGETEIQMFVKSRISWFLQKLIAIMCFLPENKGQLRFQISLGGLLWQEHSPEDLWTMYQWPGSGGWETLPFWVREVGVRCSLNKHIQHNSCFRDKLPYSIFGSVHWFVLVLA